MEIHSKGNCQDCKAADSDRPRQETLEQIGNKVLTEFSVGSGKTRTDYSFFQCNQLAESGSSTRIVVLGDMEDSGKD